MIPLPLSSRLILFTAYTQEGIRFESIQPFKDFYCAEIRTDWKKQQQGLKIRGPAIGTLFIQAASFMHGNSGDRLWVVLAQEVWVTLEMGWFQGTAPEAFTSHSTWIWNLEFENTQTKVNTPVITRRSMLMPMIAEFMCFWVRLSVDLFYILLHDGFCCAILFIGHARYSQQHPPSIIHQEGVSAQTENWAKQPSSQ